MSSATRDASDPILLRPVRVTVADDSLETRMLLRATLEGAGYEVVGEAIDGLSAIEVACERRPDVVVLDYLMPVLSGIEAIASIRDGSPESKILVLSAMMQDQVHDRLAHSAPDAWLAKDAAPSQLTQTVARLAGLGDAQWTADGVSSASPAARGGPERRADSVGRALADTRATFDVTFESAPVGIALLTTSGRFVRVNSAYEEMSGRAADELPETWPETLHLSDAALAVSAIGPLLESRVNRYDARVRFHRPDGRERSGDLRLSLLRNPAGLPLKLLVQINDVTARVEAEQKIARAFADATVPTGVVSPDGRFLQVNRAFSEMLGRPEEELVGAGLAEFLHPGDTDPVGGGSADRDARAAAWERRFVRPDGTTRWGALTISPFVGADGRPLHDVIRIRDITDTKDVRAGRVRKDTHDALTGLPDVGLLTDTLDAALSRVTRSSVTVAALWCDFDGFRAINDSLGRASGDEVLIAVAERLHAAVGPSDVIARVGGDEFVVTCDSIATPQDAESAAKRVRAALAPPFAIEGAVVSLSVSIGVALAGHDDTPDRLLGKARTAMYRAKDQGRARYVLHEPTMPGRATPRADTAQDLMRAMAEGEFVVLYQPVVELPSHRVLGMEAVVHWDHPDKGRLSAPEFLPLAEESGLIGRIGRTVIDTACEQAQRWRRSYPDSDLSIAVNLSAHELACADLGDYLGVALDSNGIPADRFCVEITETALVAGGQHGVRSLGRLNSLGVCIAIDEFGTGHASRLQNLPIDVIKIDPSFIGGIGETSMSAAIVGAIIRLADTLRVTTVAEGIERQEQEAIVSALKCTAGQGPLYGRPAEHDVVERLIARPIRGGSLAPHQQAD